MVDALHFDDVKVPHTHSVQVDNWYGTVNACISWVVCFKPSSGQTAFFFVIEQEEKGLVLFKSHNFSDTSKQCILYAYRFSVPDKAVFDINAFRSEHDNWDARHYYLKIHRVSTVNTTQLVGQCQDECGIANDDVTHL